jgi:hypothetical protein
MLELPLTGAVVLPSLVPPMPVSLGPMPSLLPVLLFMPAEFAAFALLLLPGGDCTLPPVQPLKSPKTVSMTRSVKAYRMMVSLLLAVVSVM